MLYLMASLVALMVLVLCKGEKVKSYQSVVDSCYDALESHLCEGKKWGLPFHFYRPSLEKYSPDQWLWDSGAHMIVWSHKNATNSILDLRTMLQFQQADGRIPEQIFWGERDAQGDLNILKQYSNTQFTDITQMPVLPYSLRSIYNQTHDKAVLKEFLYPLVNYFKWWRAVRDKGDGLVFVIHNWESGLDATPAYDPAFHTYITDVNDITWSHLYPKFHQLIHTYKLKYNWDMDAILNRETAEDLQGNFDTWFFVKDLAVNCVYASGWQLLADMAAELGDVETQTYCMSQYKISRDVIISKMYSPVQGHFNTLYVDTDGVEKMSVANTVQNLFPLLLHDLPSEHVESIVRMVQDPRKFNTPFAIPTVSFDDPQFEPTFEADLMWRGPVWGFTNWFVLEGLALHGQFDAANAVVDKWIKLADMSGIYEQYNPLTGEALGAVGLGMSTLVCDYIQRYGLV